MKKTRNNMLLKMEGYTEQQIYNFNDELVNSGLKPTKYLKNATKNIQAMESHPEEFNKKSDKYMLESLKLFAGMSQALVSGNKPVAKNANAVKETYDLYKQKDQEFKKLSGFKKFMARILPARLYKPAAMLKEKNEMEKLLKNDIEISQEIRDKVDDQLNKERVQSQPQQAKQQPHRSAAIQDRIKESLNERSNSSKDFAKASDMTVVKEKENQL